MPEIPGSFMPEGDKSLETRFYGAGERRVHASCGDPFPPRVAEAGLQIYEREAASQRYIDQRERAVGHIHGADT